MPDVFSISWGWWSGDQCSIDSTNGPCNGGNDSGSYNYTLVVDQGFMAQTARGITFVAGDSGAHGRTDSLCFANATRPIYPGSSPWITTVGGTQVVNQTANTNPQTTFCKNYAAGGTPCVGTGVEIVSSTYTGSGIVSGGGFSSVVPTPSWQAAAVKSYLASGALLPGNGNFNPQGRGYPDVAAFAHNVGIFQGGFAGSVDGTSCATPMIAGFVSQLNAQRVAAGKAKLGFFNPVLYGKIAAAQGAFNDVTKGDNRCTEDTLSWTDCPNCTGFGATAGWDATTGWGTPRFDVWQKVVAALN
jgi:subtilase family serine protease